MTTLLVPGQRESVDLFTAVSRGGPAATPGAGSATTLLDNVKVVHAFSLTQVSRDRAERPIPIDTQDDDVMEIELEGGFTVWTSVARYREQLARYRPDAVTDAGVRFDVLPQPSVAERGVRDWVARALRLLRLEPDDISVEFASRGGARLAAWAATKLLMALIESRLTPGPGLYQWAGGQPGDFDDRPRPLTGDPRTAIDVPPGTPILVFIHGTASSTLGSFGAFAEPEARAQWRAFRSRFGEHIYAFEHRTLSESPIKNAVQLARVLPKGALLSLVSHSRGGMVGELLCLSEITDTQIARFRRRDRELDEADAGDVANLRALRDLLADRQLQVVRFVRAACPARGTLLAGENLDHFLSVLTNLIGLIPGVGTGPVYHVIKRVTLEVAKNRARPELIPGIEAMIPTSPLVALLNSVERPAHADLAVVAGDIEGGGWLKRLGVFVSDSFIYASRDNDLVVNTDSMFEGVPRESGGHYVFDQGADVNHFSYFRNERTRSTLQHWLLARPGEIPSEYRPIERDGRPPIPMLRGIQKRSGAAQPVVFVVPDIMGSHLSVDGRRVWMDYPQLLAGGLGPIESLSDQRVEPTHLLGDYGDLCDYLSNTHEVIPFAYDWRKSIWDAGQQLAEQVRGKLAATSQPIRFVAHGMGGLLVRAMIEADQHALWDQVCVRDGSRLVMLGTPNGGSYAMVEILLGMAATIKQLALLDAARGRQGIIDIVARFPGALELLPLEDASLFSPGSWDAFRGANGGCGARPSADALSSALKALRRLPDALPHAGRVLYVAGSAPVTPCGAAIENGRAVLKATSQGDGRVTHASGRLPGVATWYVEAEHGELADSPGVFPAILELLQTGTTARLATTPSAERAIPSGFTYVPEPVLYPTEADLAAGAMGRRRKPRVAKAGGTMRVRVVHGDLRYARYPIMVGHYEGDTIAGAEAQLDRRLDHALSDRYQLGLYPGELGTVAVLQRESTRFAKELGLPKGAIVVGLGKMGELSAGVLADVVRKGTLQYVMHLADAAPPPGEPIAAPDGHRPTVDAGLSVLLIGANTASSMTVNDSVGAIVRGVARANREIEQTLGSGARVSEIELVELFADAAIQATYAARALAASLSDELGIRIDVASVLERGRGAQNRLIQTQNRDYWRRVVVTRIDSGDSQPVRPPLPEEWARRLLGTVLEESQGDAARVEAALDLLVPSWRRREQPEGTLRFLALSDRARAEVIMQDRQPELIERLVKTSVGDTRFKRETANTLFQLLVPNALKESLAQQSWLVLVVDGDTAAYPWELMVDGQEPLSARIGMVRQLETARFRPQIRASTSRVVYVVGDPVTSEGIAPLPGARAEATMVAALFRGHDYEVTHGEERPLAEDVLNGLFAQPYRILHLAGHGYYQPPSSDGRRARSGMVLDTGVYLTAVEIGQMRQVPDLVFLNCCHLAQVGPGGPAPSSAVPYNRLAASISRELIEMGVRAVVAAGWAVRDDAANAFAKAFYEAMLGGETFGRALLLARQENARRFPDCNTWGAYQAYGDPDFKLNPKGDGAAHSTDTLPFVAAEELINELARLRQQAAEARRAEAAEAAGKPARRDREPDMFARIRTLFDACPPEWRGRGDVLTALGETYGELGAAGFEQAVDYYTRALAVEDLEGRVPLRVIEELANLEARHGAKTQPPRRELIERAIDRLRGLLALSPSAERLRLMASAYKRLAQVAATPADARAAVEESAAHYEKASQIHLERSAIDPYSVLNWLACRAVLGQPAPETETWLSRCEAASTERFARSHAFWDAVIRLDAAVLRHLLKGDLDAAEDDLVARYTDAREEAQATPREFDSVLDQLGFIASMVDRIGKGTGLAASPEALLKPLGRIRARLAGERIPPEDGARAMPARPSAMSPPAPKRKARRPPRARR